MTGTPSETVRVAALLRDVRRRGQQQLADVPVALGHVAAHLPAVEHLRLKDGNVRAIQLPRGGDEAADNALAQGEDIAGRQLCTGLLKQAERLVKLNLALAVDARADAHDGRLLLLGGGGDGKRREDAQRREQAGEKAIHKT